MSSADSSRHGADLADRAGGAVRRESREMLAWLRNLQLADLLVVALMCVGPLPGLGSHTSEIFLALLAVLALFRRPRYDLGSLGLLVPVFVVLLTYIGLISMFMPSVEGAADWRLRLVRITAVTFMIFALASGRIDLRSGIVGAVLVSAVNVPLFYSGALPDNYGGYLTGVFGDKNFAGLMYASIGVLATSLVRRLPMKILIYLAFAAPLWFTGSRTSLAGYALAAVWMLVGARLPDLGKIALGALSVWALILTSEDYSRVGVFSDRLGSDKLRARIDAASWDKVQETGFFGRGLGNAFVHIQDRDWFFHNSYWSAYVEGGWPWTVFVVGVTAVVLLPVLRRADLPPLCTSAGLGLVMLVTASRLGEVFYTLPWGIAIGFGIQSILRARIPGEDPDTLLPERAGVIGGHSGRGASSHALGGQQQAVAR